MCIYNKPPSQKCAPILGFGTIFPNDSQSDMSLRKANPSLRDTNVDGYATYTLFHQHTGEIACLTLTKKHESKLPDHQGCNHSIT